MGETKEDLQRGESWATSLNIETFKGDDIVRARKIEDFTKDRNGNEIILKRKEENDKGAGGTTDDTKVNN